MSSLMTETLLQPDVTPLPPETGFSSSRDRVRIHRAQEIRTVPRGGFSACQHSEQTVTVPSANGETTQVTILRC
jgi:hypothetical protein